MEFTVGCDPELFAIRKTENGVEAVSAHDLIPGDKKNPHKVTGGAIQVDGTAVEFNTDPVPIKDFNAWNANIVTVLKELSDAVRQKDPSIGLLISPVQEYPQEYFDSLPPEAKELGCDPDYCAYTLEPNPRPPGDRNFRTGAGHIHIGWGADIPVDNREHHEICASFVKMLDATVGMFMTVIDPDPRRRELYGKAGAYRAKPYGVEYRFPSNVWLKSRGSRAVVHNLLNTAIDHMQRGNSVRWVCGLEEGDVERVLNFGDRDTAKRNVCMMSSVAEKYLYSAQYKKDFPNG